MAIDPSRPRAEPESHERLELVVRTLFTCDATGNLVDVNEPGGPRAPRLFFAWHGGGLIWRVRDDLPPALTARIAALVAGSPTPHDMTEPPACVAAVRDALAEHAPVPELDGSGPEYCFPDEVDAPAGAVAVTGANASVLRRWLPRWLPDVATGLPVMTVLVDGDGVAICATVRTPGAATEAGVETHPAFRGRGHAVTVTAAWARAVRERGILPLYGTSWQNHASRRVAAKLGLIQFCSSLSIE